MASECFCGCGREVPFGRKRAANMIGDRMRQDIALFEGSLERSPDPEHDADLRRLVATGATLRDKLRDVVHGTGDRKDYPKDDGKRWMSEAGAHRERITMRAVKAGDFVGWKALDQAVLAETGVAAPATIVDIRDTGVTVNERPRALIVLRVDGPDGPFELSRKVTVSRVKIPRVGENVTVYYDPKDRSKFTFRMGDLADDPPPVAAAADPVEQIAKLAALRDAGTLSDDEFAQAKQRLLADL
jgi:hypothetical protein